MGLNAKPEPRYRWSHPSEWLSFHVDRLANDDSAEAHSELVKLVMSLASLLDGDQIQDLFQDEMDRDGYFNDLNEEDEEEE